MPANLFIKNYKNKKDLINDYMLDENGNPIDKLQKSTKKWVKYLDPAFTELAKNNIMAFMYPLGRSWIDDAWEYVDEKICKIFNIENDSEENIPYIFYMAPDENQTQIYLKFNLPLEEQRELAYKIMEKHFGENFSWSKKYVDSMILAIKNEKIKIKPKCIDLFVQKLVSDNHDVKIIKRGIFDNGEYDDEAVSIIQFEGDHKKLEKDLTDKNKYYLSPDRRKKQYQDGWIDASQFRIDKKNKLLYVNLAVQIETETYNYISDGIDEYI